MAYGQTGSGKSFTMQEDPDHIGIIPRAIVHVFQVRLLSKVVWFKRDCARTYLQNPLRLPEFFPIGQWNRFR